MTPARRWLLPATVALLALATSVTSLGHDFTYDDRYVILLNDRVHGLHAWWRLFAQTYWPPSFGGDGYRPAIMTLFSAEWVAGHGSARTFHLVSILMAVTVALAVLWCARALLPATGAWVASALFAVHPVHVEVTGNIVGQSELLVAGCTCLAMGIYLRARGRGALAAREATSIVALFAVALFSKEHAVVLPALMLVAECTVLHDDTPWRDRVRAARPLALAMIAVTLAYLFLRGRVKGDLSGFEPVPVFRFLHMTAVDRILTMMTEMPRIARLLVFPTHLSADYSPQDVSVAHGLDVAQVPGMAIVLGVMILAVALRRRAPVIAFGIGWVIVAFLPVSNFLVPAGFVTAERTLFLPSVGVVIAAGAVAMLLVRRCNARITGVAATVLAALLLAGAWRSVDRQRVWKNNDVFVDQLVKDAPDGYRAHFLRGRQVGLAHNPREMELEYRRAIRLFPYDVAMTLAVADGYTRAGICKPAADLFEWTYAVDSLVGEGRYEYVYCLARLGRWPDARREALAALHLVPPGDIRLLRRAIRQADSVSRAQRR